MIPTTRKKKKARKSREVDMLSDTESLDVMLGGNLLERTKVKLVTMTEGPKVPVMAHY